MQIDIDPKRIGLRYPAHIGLVGDCARVLGALLPKVQPKQDKSFLTQAQHRMKEWRHGLPYAIAAAVAFPGR